MKETIFYLTYCPYSRSRVLFNHSNESYNLTETELGRVLSSNLMQILRDKRSIKVTISVEPLDETNRQ